MKSCNLRNQLRRPSRLPKEQDIAEYAHSKGSSITISSVNVSFRGDFRSLPPLSLHCRVS
jgi:hypothetical protein